MEILVDLVMWARNSERTLEPVLRRIEEVIPNENINQKIFVDYRSEDGTTNIARKYGWTVYEAKEMGIGSAANEALRHVKTKFFVSVEHDVILAKNWWEKIPPYLSDPTVAVAQGVRVATNRILGVFDMIRVNSKEPYLCIDQNIYNTRAIRSLGGFPNVPLATDLALQENVFKSGFRWVTDKTVVSLHMRRGVWQEGKHIFEMTRRNPRMDEVMVKKHFRNLILSPFYGLKLAKREKMPLLILANVYLRIMKLRGSIYANAAYKR